MEILEIMQARHSIRQYMDRIIEKEKRESLQELIEECNKESGLNIQILFDEPKCFDSMMAHYGKFSGVSNYIALVGKRVQTLRKRRDIMEKRLSLLHRRWD